MENVATVDEWIRPVAGLSCRPRILIAEDDDDVALAMSVALGGRYDVTVRESAHALARSYERERPEVLLIDYQLPDMNGIRLFELLRRKYGSETPAVMVSAHPSRRRASLRAGFESFLSKPFDLEDLFQVVRELLVRQL